MKSMKLVKKEVQQLKYDLDHLKRELSENRIMWDSGYCIEPIKLEVLQADIKQIYLELQRIRDYLGVVIVTTPESTKLVKRSPAKRAKKK